MGIFGDFARRYFEAGYIVCPIETKSKACKIKEWNKIFMRGMSEDVLEQFITSHADHGIGLICGQASNIVAVDWDFQGHHEKILEEMVLGILPPTPVVKKGKKGWTRFYQLSDGIKLVHLKREGKAFLDIIADGPGYTVLPPSMHSEGIEYHYISPDTLLDISASELPLLSGSDVEALRNVADFSNAEVHDINKEGRHNVIFGFVLKNASLCELDELVNRALQFDALTHSEHKKGRYFKDRSQAEYDVKRFVEWKKKRLAAKGVAWDVAGDEVYAEYEAFFKEYLKGAKKDIITKQFLKFDGQYWQSPLNNLDAIKSYAMGKDLSQNKVMAHLDRFILEKPYELLIDIPKWDGIDRIKELGLYIKFKDRPFEVFEDALKEWGANVFRRLYGKNMQNRCIILKGEQGIGKDLFLKSILSGFDLYYQSFTSNRDERECWAQVTESLVLHIEEFDQTGVMPIAFLKDLMTRDTVKYRSPYDRKAQVKKCVGSFISTVNIDDILRDETGNRRFAVFEVEKIDWNYPKELGHQILAQFHALYLADFWAQKSTWEDVSKSNEKFQIVDIVPELLDHWDVWVAELSRRAGGGINCVPVQELSFGVVSTTINELSRISGFKTRKILSILKINGRSRKTKLTTVYWSNLIKTEHRKLSLFRSTTDHHSTIK